MKASDDIYNSEFDEVDGNFIHKTAIINSNVKLGTGNRIGAYTVIGSNGEVRGVQHDHFYGTVEIGNDNLISEHVTIQTPQPRDAVTRIGSRNLITAHSHIGHDAQIGNDTEICISTIGGYAEICDGARIKMNAVIRNRVRVGCAATVGMGAVVVKNVPYGATVYGNPAREHTKE